jgi:hypothetical protein
MGICAIALFSLFQVVVSVMEICGQHGQFLFGQQTLILGFRVLDIGV